MRSYFTLTLGLFLAFPLSAHAQFDKHKKSIANHGYSIPVTVYETPMLSQPGQTLRDDIEQGGLQQAPVTTPTAPILEEQVQELMIVPSLPPAMPPAINLKSDVDTMTEKKTLNNEKSASTPLEILAKKALSEGDTAKNFSLPNAVGKSVDLYQELQKGPVVLIWYRGGWCPYCNLQLKSFQDELATIAAAGAQLIAVSPELPDNSMTTAQKNNLSYQVLSDTNNTAAREYGLVYTAPDDLFEKLPDLDLKKHNGSETRELPLAATYVIESDGTIAYAMITPDYRERAQPADVITILGNIAAKESIRKSRIRQALERAATKLDQKNKMAVVPVELVAEETTSRIEKLEDTTTLKPAVELKPMVDVVENPQTTLEVRAKEEGLIPESY